MFILLATIQVLGFAPDDSRVAYVETAAAQGSSEATAKLHVVDTAKNADRVSTFTGADAEQQATKAGNGSLKVFKLAEWAKPKAISHDEHGALSTESSDPVGNLVLALKAARGSKMSKGQACEAGFESKSLDLKLYQADDDKPRSVGSSEAACRADCKIDSIFASHHKAALFLIKCSTSTEKGKADVVLPFAKVLTYGLDEDIPAQ